MNQINSNGIQFTDPDKFLRDYEKNLDEYCTNGFEDIEKSSYSDTELGELLEGSGGLFHE